VKLCCRVKGLLWKQRVKAWELCVKLSSLESSVWKVWEQCVLQD